MKSLLACVFLMASAAEAQTLTDLQSPPGVVTNSQSNCVATTFNADDSVNGTCKNVRYGACSGRGCQPAQYITVYATTWDVDGNVLSNAVCGNLYYHLPVQRWTYNDGYDASSCFLPLYSSWPRILIGNYWYGYITTSTDGAYELLTFGKGGVIGKF